MTRLITTLALIFGCSFRVENNFPEIWPEYGTDEGDLGKAPAESEAQAVGPGAGSVSAETLLAAHGGGLRGLGQAVARPSEVMARGRETSAGTRRGGGSGFPVSPGRGAARGSEYAESGVQRNLPLKPAHVLTAPQLFPSLWRLGRVSLISKKRDKRDTYADEKQLGHMPGKECIDHRGFWFNRIIQHLDSLSNCGYGWPRRIRG